MDTIKAAKIILYGISEAARLAGVSEDTLRRYEAAGAIAPLRCSTGRRRLFTDDDIAQARAHRERLSAACR